MDFLMQPIYIDGNYYCPVNEGNRTTDGVAVDIAPLTNSADVSNGSHPWYLWRDGGGSGGSVGRVDVGLAWGSKAQVHIEVYKFAPSFDWSVWLDDVLIDSGTHWGSGVSPGYTIPVPIDFTAKPCGSIVTIHATAFSVGTDLDLPCDLFIIA